MERGLEQKRLEMEYIGHLRMETASSLKWIIGNQNQEGLEMLKMD